MLFKTTHAQCATGDVVKNAREAAREIKEALKDFDASLLIFFAATDYDPDTLAREMHDAFPGVVTLGCSTAGEGLDGKMYNASVVAMGFSTSVFDYCESAVVLDNAPHSDGDDVFLDAQAAMRHLVRKLDYDPMDIDYRKYVGFMLGDAITDFAEKVLMTVGEMTNVIFVGGFAGDDQKFNGEQYVFYRGKAYRDAAILCLWKPRAGFSLLKTQAVETTDTSFIITRADEPNRIIWEFDHQDAVKVYADAIDAPIESMNIIDFDEHPLAMTVDGEPFLGAILRQVDGRGLRMFTRVTEGTRQILTHSGDLCTTTRENLERKIREMGGASAILHVNCSSRHTALRNKNQVDEFAEIFGVVPSISFSSYGEIYVGIVALTSTMILFK